MKLNSGRYRLRLRVGLPLVVICFTLAAGFLPIGMFDNALARESDPAALRSLVLNLKVWVLLITFVATVLAVLISLHIVQPVERIIREIEDFAGHGENADGTNGHAAGGVDDEIDRLSKLYNQTFVPMKGYLTTADLFLQMSEGILSLNADGKIAFLNDPIERLLGIDRQQYTGKHFKDLFPNSDRNVEIHDLIRDVLLNGAVRSRDVLVSTPGGRDVFVRATASPATGRHKQSIGVVMLFQNIEELSRLRDQFRRMDVLASIGSTIAGMAHEVRTPLGYIRGLAELIKEDLPREAPQHKYVDTIVESIDRLNLLVEDILSLASVKVNSSETIDPAELLHETVAYVREPLEAKNLRLIEDYPRTQRFMKADRQKLMESFLNILKNACDAAPVGAALSVKVRSASLGTLNQKKYDTVIIEFHNEGSYISAETREKLFTPFFTTKKQGTGLGLAISKQIVEAHGGAIQIESEETSGTLFRLLLPAGAETAPSLQIPVESAVQ